MFYSYFFQLCCFEDKNCMRHLGVRNKIVPGSKMCLLPGIIFAPSTKIRLLPATKAIPGSKRILLPGIKNCARQSHGFTAYSACRAQLDEVEPNLKKIPHRNGIWGLKANSM